MKRCYYIAQLEIRQSLEGKKMLNMITRFELNTQNVTESQGQKNDQWFSYLCAYKISQR